ncbi:MAG: hypothetical protein ACTHOK_12010 [Nocardioidaceae bacterium]
MRRRTILAATVVGALFVGGAATGTTLALWRDQAPLAGQLRAGTMSLTIDGKSTSVQLGAVSGLTLGKTSTTPGTPVAMSTAPLMKFEAPVEARNLRLQVHLDAVAPSQTSSVLDQDLEVGATAVPAVDACPDPTTLTYQAIGPGYNSALLTAWKLAPLDTAKLCIAARLKAGASDSTLGLAQTLTFTIRGQQARP